eukprot:318044_1
MDVLAERYSQGHQDFCRKERMLPTFSSQNLETCSARDCNGERCTFTQQNVPMCECGGDYLNSGDDCQNEFVVFRIQIRDVINSVRIRSAVSPDFENQFIRAAARATNVTGDPRARFRVLDAYACGAEVACPTEGSVLDLQVRGQRIRRTALN